jgi:hypothetical protein
LLPVGLKEHYFFDEVIPESRAVEMLFFPIELNDILRILFFFWFATLLKEWVLHALIDRKSEVGVKN